MIGAPELSAPAPQPAPTPAPAQPAANASGLSINNPLNLRPMPGGNWQGQTGVSPGGFATFGDAASGWDAADQNLQAKVTKHGLTSVQSIIGDPTYGWAPASDHNNPAAYANTVATALGVRPTDDISQRLTTDANFRHQMLSAMAGVETGKQVAFGGSGAADLAGMILTPQERATWDASGGPSAGTYVPPGGQPQKPGGAPQGESDAIKFLTLHGAYDENAPVGSIRHPAGQEPGKGPPTEAGQWYVTPEGQIRVAGDSTPDYLPVFRKSIADNNPIGAITSPLFQGSVMDTIRSANRFGMGSAFSSDPAVQALGEIQGAPTQQQSRSAAESALAAQERNYQASQIGNPNAPALRFTGQGIVGTAAGLAVPEAELPAALGGPGKLVAQGITNALRGVATAAPSVGANKAPVSQQLAAAGAAGVALPSLWDLGAKTGTALTGFGRTVSTDVADLANTAATKYGIPLRSGQVMAANGDRGAGFADSQLLGSNAKVRANNDAQREAWMKGVTGTYGDASGDVSPDALMAARQRIGGVMNDVAQRTTIADADALQTKLGTIIQDAQHVLPDNEVAPLLKQVESIAQTRQGKTISGDAYQSLTRKGAPLDRLESSPDPNVAYYAGQMREALDDALQASARPEDVQALQSARFQYKNLMTVAKLAPKQDVSGFLPPALLRGAVNTNFKNAAFKGAGDLGELAQIGQIFMKEAPSSGTSERLSALVKPFLTGATTAGATDLGMALLHQPENALGTGVSALTGATAKAAYDALQRNRIGGSAANIINRSLPSAPGTVNALSGAVRAARPVRVPLSALAGVRLDDLINGGGGVPAGATANAK